MKCGNGISSLLVGDHLPTSTLLQSGYTPQVYKLTEGNINNAVFWLEDEYGVRGLAPDSLVIKVFKYAILAVLAQK